MDPTSTTGDQPGGVPEEGCLEFTYAVPRDKDGNEIIVKLDERAKLCREWLGWSFPANFLQGLEQKRKDNGGEWMR